MTEFEIPAFYRILIIDDKVANDPNCHVPLRAVLKAIVDNVIKNRVITEVIFENDPVKGFTRWCDEVFDLVLIDEDFSGNLKEKENDFEKIIINSRNQGRRILEMMQQSTEEDGAFSYRCQEFDMPNALTSGKFLLWSGKKQQEVGRFTLPKKVEKRKGYETLSKIIEGTLNCNTSTLEKVERLVFAVRKNYGDIQSRLHGGCLIIEEESEKDSFQSDGILQFGSMRNTQEDKAFLISLCPSRIPSKVLDADKEKCFFVPFHKYIYDGGLADVIRFIQSGINNKINKEKKIKEYCEKINSRYGRKNKFLPFYKKGHKLLPFCKKGHKLLSLEPSKDYDNRFSKTFYLAAATPLTGISVIGEGQAVESLCCKVTALLNGPFGGVVLKTAYLDKRSQWENACWPGIQVQSHMRSRCLYPETGSPTLWNTGKTALEMLPPETLNIFLKHFSAQILNEAERETQCKRIIISLGSKFFNKYDISMPWHRDQLEGEMKEIWDKLFEDVFKGKKLKGLFPVVEINVRHFLREIIKAYVGGDEYLSPTSLNDSVRPEHEVFWQLFGSWLKVVHDVAVKHKKKIILKLPHRSDNLAFIKKIISLRKYHLLICGSSEKDYGVNGITLVNALKTPVHTPPEDNLIAFTPYWYAHPEKWEDAGGKKFKYQMSGARVSTYRNQILAGIIPDAGKFSQIGLEIFLSGGITSRSDLDFCKKMQADMKNVITAFQIGTWGLLGTELGESSWDDIHDPIRPGNPVEVRYEVDFSKCDHCPTCFAEKICDNIEKGKDDKRIAIDKNLCLECNDYRCIEACRPKKLTKTIFKPGVGNESFDKKSRQIEKAITPRMSYLDETRCVSCGKCQKTFYCDAFLDRSNIKLSPLIDPRNCTGCGLCVQVCNEGALHLYRPDEFLVLISDSEERKGILKQKKIPFFSYSPTKDIHHIKIMGNISNITPDDVGKLFEDENFDISGFINAIWEERLKHDRHILSENSTLYPDKRLGRKKICIETAEVILKKIKDVPADHEKMAKKRAVIWSQIIWSDPGQVLWDSFIITVQSRLVKHYDENKKDSESLDLNAVQGSEKIMLSSYVVLLHQGRVIFMKEFLKSNFSYKDYKEKKYQSEVFAGLPLEEIRTEIKKTSNDTYKKFNKVLTAVKKRKII